MPPRAGTFPKDLISNSAYKLLSGNLPFTVSHRQSEAGKGEMESSPLPHTPQDSQGLAWHLPISNRESGPTTQGQQQEAETKGTVWKEMQNRYYDFEI